MSTKKSKFYVVWKGLRPGVYSDWGETLKQVHGYEGAKYKSFETRSEAESAFAEHHTRHIRSVPRGTAVKAAEKSPGTKKLDQLEKLGVDPNGMAVDAACSGVPGPMEYRGTWLANGEEAFRIGPLPDGTNNIGEFLAIVHAAAMLKKAGRTDVPIYSDSRIAIGWVKRRICRTRQEQTPDNDRIFELIARAMTWLQENPVQNPVLKWETNEWGENPADFGRK